MLTVTLKWVKPLFINVWSLRHMFKVSQTYKKMKTLPRMRRKNRISQKVLMSLHTPSLYLNDTLEVDVHGVGELECLEVCVADHAGAGAKVLDLLEPGHDLGPGDAAQLVHQLDGGALPVVRHAVTHQHVELVLVVLCPEGGRKGPF